MKIEIQEFFPVKPRNKSHDLSGTLSVYVIDYDLDIRGIVVSRYKGKYFIQLPSKPAFDEDGKQKVENGRKMRYPTVTFVSKDKQDALMQEIRKKAPEFIESYVGEK